MNQSAGFCLYILWSSRLPNTKSHSEQTFDPLLQPLAASLVGSTPQSFIGTLIFGLAFIFTLWCQQEEEMSETKRASWSLSCWRSETGLSCFCSERWQPACKSNLSQLCRKNHKPEKELQENLKLNFRQSELNLFPVLSHQLHFIC